MLVLSDFISCNCSPFSLPKADIFHLSSFQLVKEQRGKTISFQNRWAYLWFAKLQKLCSSPNPARKNLGAKLDAENPCLSWHNCLTVNYVSGYKTIQPILFPFAYVALNSPDYSLVILGLWTVNLSHWLCTPVDSLLLTADAPDFLEHLIRPSVLQVHL